MMDAEKENRMKREQLYTTFRILRECHACKQRYKHLAHKLGGVEKYGEDTPIAFARILEINGYEDVMWAFQMAAPEEQAKRLDKLLRLFACWCVRNTPLHDGRKVWDLLTNKRSRNAVEVAERYARGKATEEELAAAKALARDPARTAAWDTTKAAARNAAWNTAWASARAATRNAAKNAACAAAGDAAGAAAWDAAWAAQEKQQRKILTKGGA